MKNILKISALLLLINSFKSYSQILDIQDMVGEYTTGVYYKDLNNLLDPFVGTYIYSNGTTQLKIVLQKKIMSTPTNNRFQEDLIIGEYQYIENGVEKINTLNKFNNNYTNGWKYSLNGSMIINYGSNRCFECLPNDKVLYLGIAENLTDNTGSIIVKRILVNNQEAIKIFINYDMRGRTEFETLPNAIIPYGYHILIKQP